MSTVLRTFESLKDANEMLLRKEQLKNKDTLGIGLLSFSFLVTCGIFFHSVAKRH